MTYEAWFQIKNKCNPHASMLWITKSALLLQKMKRSSSPPLQSLLPSQIFSSNTTSVAIDEQANALLILLVTVWWYERSNNYNIPRKLIMNSPQTIRGGDCNPRPSSLELAQNCSPSQILVILKHLGTVSGWLDTVVGHARLSLRVPCDSRSSTAHGSSMRILSASFWQVVTLVSIRVKMASGMTKRTWLFISFNTGKGIQYLPLLQFSLVYMIFCACVRLSR